MCTKHKIHKGGCRSCMTGKMSGSGKGTKGIAGDKVKGMYAHSSKIGAKKESQ